MHLSNVLYCIVQITSAPFRIWEMFPRSLLSEAVVATGGKRLRCCEGYFELRRRQYCDRAWVQEKDTTEYDIETFLSVLDVWLCLLVETQMLMEQEPEQAVGSNTRQRYASALNPAVISFTSNPQSWGYPSRSKQPRPSPMWSKFSQINCM